MFRGVLFIALMFVAAPVMAEDASFSDVPKAREEYAAVEDLKNRGIFEGRPDGTFGPDEFVNRAEAITVIVRAVANIKNLPDIKKCFPDVYGEEWYVRPVCYAEDLGWVSGYPDGTYQPVRTVSKVEFLKILLNAYGVDTDPISKLNYPVAPDAPNPEEWYFPYLSFALSSSMTSADSFGRLNPGIALTRGQVALMIHRFIMYREGQRNQNLLTYAEKDTRAVFTNLDNLEVDLAGYAANRVRVAAWGVRERLPTSNVVLVTVKLGEALSLLVKAYDQVKGAELADALVSTQEAYGIAGEADKINGGVTVYTDRVRSYAHELADEIRAYGEDSSE